MRHLDVCTHMQYPADRDILTRSNFDVNMRLFKSSEGYRKIILAIADYINDLGVKEKEGYKLPHGWSGANAGIPFSIISVQGKVYLNPKIVKASTDTKEVQSNCGSLTLEESKTVNRHASIDLEYYDTEGVRHLWQNIPPTPGFTIQHEVNHTQGILI